jgi:putative oxidoreductase
MSAGRRGDDVALLLLRLAGVGLAVFHGWPKLQALLTGTSRFHEGLASMGFPFPIAFAWAAALAETVASVFVVAGFFTRVAAALCAFTMLVAAFARHHAHVHLLALLGLWHGSPDTLKSWGSPELALLYALPFVALVLAGAGRFSVDRGKR